MSDPVAELNGELERASYDKPAAPDAPPRSLDAEEVPHDAGIEEQLAKKQGPMPSSNRTQVEQDAEHVADTGAIDVNNETEDISPILTPDDMNPAPPEGSVEADLKEKCDRIADELEEIADLKASLDRVVAAAKKVSEPETIDVDVEELRKTAQQRVARILVKAGMDVGIGLPSEVRPVNQRLINELNEESRPSPNWEDMGWWYEKNFKVAEDKREVFKTALFLEMAGNGERSHQFVVKDVDDGVKVSVDRTPAGLNPQFTKDVDRIYENQFQGHEKVAADIKAIIIRKTMVPQEDHVCPHCEQVIGEKETYWPEEYRDHPDLHITQHRPCGGLFSEPRAVMDLEESLKGLFEKKDHGNPFGVCDPGKPHTHEKLAYQPDAKEIKTSVTLEGKPECVGSGLAMLKAMAVLGGWGSSRRLRTDVDGDGAFNLTVKSDELSDKQMMNLLDELFVDGDKFSTDKDEIAINSDSAIPSIKIDKKVKKAAADLPYRRRVEVILTDGLNVWGEKKTPEKGGVWFPGGGVDARDEKFADAAAREVVEESGFTIKEIYRLANVAPCTCDWDKATIEESEKWAEKGKKWKGDRTYMYVATVDTEGEPTSTEGDAMDGEWMTYASAIRKLRNAVPHDNQGWQRLTRTRLRAIMQLAPAGLKVPRRGDIEDFVEEVTDGVESV